MAIKMVIRHHMTSRCQNVMDFVKFIKYATSLRLGGGGECGLRVGAMFCSLSMIKGFAFFVYLYSPESSYSSTVICIPRWEEPPPPR